MKGLDEEEGVMKGLDEGEGSMKGWYEREEEMKVRLREEGQGQDGEGDAGGRRVEE